jgi:hypothetical protein
MKPVALKLVLEDKWFDRLTTSDQIYSNTER